jgi:hypothetical protein
LRNSCGLPPAHHQVDQPVGGAGFVAEQGTDEAAVLDQRALGDAAPGVVESQRVRAVEPIAAASSAAVRPRRQGLSHCAPGAQDDDRRARGRCSVSEACSKRASQGCRAVQASTRIVAAQRDELPAGRRSARPVPPRA